MKNNKGIVEAAILLYLVIGGLVLLFVPNPISTATGIGIRPNKIVHKEKVDLINDGKGNIVATRTTVSDDDIQQHITFWEWLGSLPIFVLFLMGLGVVFPPVAMVLGNIYRKLKEDTKKIVVGVDKALDKITDPASKQTILDEMEKHQDTSTKALVDKIQGK